MTTDFSSCRIRNEKRINADSSLLLRAAIEVNPQFAPGTTQTAGHRETRRLNVIWRPMLALNLSIGRLILQQNLIP